MTKEDFLKKTLQELGSRYVPGLYEFLFRYRGDLYSYLMSLEDKIDEAFLYGTEEELRSTLKEYWALHMKAIQIFRESNEQDFDLRKTREEILENRLSI